MIYLIRTSVNLGTGEPNSEERLKIFKINLNIWKKRSSENGVKISKFYSKQIFCFPDTGFSVF